ncbi:MAG: hypothetical protein EVA87_04035 [Rhodospirillaceae bacterium]|nr:hypothetical protein [Rhodospirillaceae bacterium]RPF99655.1 MAG: hypothetical protein CBC23_007035 [Rhodospirillaceae bacterium TMED63]RZO38145.1 MAG: hypothetical protein EVA87_04035 [Rhodospirillaceae bacterium]
MLSTYSTKIASIATVVLALVLFASPGNSASFRVLMAVSAYAEEAGPPIPEFADNPARPQPEDFPEIACEYLKAWAATDMARAGVFARRYDEGEEMNRAEVLLGCNVSPTRRLADRYLVKLCAAFSRSGDENPFASPLGRQKLIRR